MYAVVVMYLGVATMTAITGEYDGSHATASTTLQLQRLREERFSSLEEGRPRGLERTLDSHRIRSHPRADDQRGFFFGFAGKLTTILSEFNANESAVRHK
eukprot:7407833-Pyramimonas_sp.AAC.1